ncbi:hypothetical protein ACFLVY_00715 [Chloroflexota bacterium]
MTTARERYEKKTKVITFRVSQEMAQQITEVKAETGLSNADLVKLGAGIAREEIKAKLTEVTGLEARLAEVEASLLQEEQTLSEFLTAEKERRMKELDTDMEALHLFDQDWKVEEVSIKLGISQKTACRYFDKWADIRQDREAIQRELVRRCLLKHIEMLKSRRSWATILSDYSDEDRQEIEEAIETCQRLLSNLDHINQADKEYLIGEYSSQVLRY